MTIDNKLVKVICAILFCVFTFSYLFFYQADILRVTQHIASGGQTFYVPWVGWCADHHFFTVASGGTKLNSSS